MLQVSRFRPDGSGRLRRHVTSVLRLTDCVNIPVFRGELDIHYVQYRPVAVLCHYGTLPTCGHYIGFLIEHSPLGIWKCDDNIKPTNVTAAPSELAKHAYGILYARM